MPRLRITHRVAFHGPYSLGGEIGHQKALQTSQERDSNPTEPNAHAIVGTSSAKFFDASFSLGVLWPVGVPSKMFHPTNRRAC